MGRILVYDPESGEYVKDDRSASLRYEARDDHVRMLEREVKDVKEDIRDASDKLREAKKRDKTGGSLETISDVLHWENQLARLRAEESEMVPLLRILKKKLNAINAELAKGMLSGESDNGYARDVDDLFK